MDRLGPIILTVVAQEVIESKKFLLVFVFFGNQGRADFTFLASSLNELSFWEISLSLSSEVPSWKIFFRCSFEATIERRFQSGRI